MVSESQERMLCVVEPARRSSGARALRALGAARGRDRRGHRRRRVRVLDGARRVGEHARSTRSSTSARSYDLAARQRAERAARTRRRAARWRPPPDPGEALLALLASPNIAAAGRCSSSTTAIVQSRTVRRPGRPTPRCSRCPATAHARSPSAIDGNGRRVAADPYRGTIEAVLECAANLACVGAEPLAVDQLPELRQPREAAHRLAADRVGARARRRLPRAASSRSSAATSRSTTRAPTAPIYPTPVIGMVGELPDARLRRRSAFAPRDDRDRDPGRPVRADAGGSRAVQLRGEAAARRPGRRSTSTRVRATQLAVRDAVRAGACSSAHDIAEGGLAVALAECCLAGGLGGGGRRWPATFQPARRFASRPFFGEARGGFIVSGPRATRRAQLSRPVAVQMLGVVGGEPLKIERRRRPDPVRATLGELAAARQALGSVIA